MNSWVVKCWAIAFIAFGATLCFYKSQVLGLPIVSQQKTDIWTIQARIRFTGSGGPAKVTLQIPKHVPGYVSLDEDFIASGFGLTVDEQVDGRRARWAVRRARGEQTVYYRATIARSPFDDEWNSFPAFPVVPDYPEPYGTAVREVIKSVRSESADIASFTQELIRQLNSPNPTENIELIQDGVRDNVAWVEEIIHVLKGVRIPARAFWVLPLSSVTNDVQLSVLLQVHNGDRWLTFHPRSGSPGIPADVLPWYVGNEPLLSLDGGRNEELSYSLTRTYSDLVDVAKQRAVRGEAFLANFSLLSLPVENQNVYRLLLMLPLGALIIVILRVFVGLQTFGTFMPVLMALAFRETQLLWGVGLFCLIVAIGLILRFYLERLRLLLVPRLASILVIVVIIMLFISLTTAGIKAERFLSVSLFPVVILAMTIERMSITWEESGARQSLIQGAGSLFAACIGYVVMTNEQLMYAFFAFPELLLVVLGICLWMGQYTGYRLSELFRFQGIVAPKHAVDEKVK